jgi:hypothetical protein
LFPLFIENEPINEGVELPPEIAKLMRLGLQFTTP